MNYPGHGQMELRWNERVTPDPPATCGSAGPGVAARPLTPASPPRGVKRAVPPAVFRYWFYRRCWDWAAVFLQQTRPEGFTVDHCDITATAIQAEKWMSNKNMSGLKMYKDAFTWHENREHALTIYWLNPCVSLSSDSCAQKHSYKIFVKNLCEYNVSMCLHSYG